MISCSVIMVNKTRDFVMRGIGYIKRKLNPFFVKIESKSLWYLFLYLTARIYVKRPWAKSVVKRNSNRPIKKVVMVYSRRHFDPKEDSPTRKFATTSTAELARSLYKTFTNCEVIYRDISDPIIDIQDADMIIGILSKSYYEYCKKNSGARKILVLVNSHPIYRIKVLFDEAIKNSVEIAHIEYVSPFLPIRCMEISDTLLVRGTKYIENTDR